MTPELIWENEYKIGVWICPKRMKKFKCERRFPREIKNFEKAVYKFSRSTLNRLLQNEANKHLFLAFFSSDNFRNFLEADPTMNKNREAYYESSNFFV